MTTPKKTKTTWAGLNHMPLTPFTSEAAIENVIFQSGVTEHRSVIYLHFWNVCLGKAIGNITWVFLEWNQYYSYNYTECPFSESSCSCWGHFCLSSSSVPINPATTTHSSAGRRGCTEIVSPWKQSVPAGRLSSTHAAGDWMDSCACVCPFSKQLCTCPFSRHLCTCMSFLQTAVHVCVPFPDSCALPRPFLWTAAGAPSARQRRPHVQQPLQIKSKAYLNIFSLNWNKSATINLSTFIHMFKYAK